MTKSCIFGALLSALVLVGCDRDVHVDNRSQDGDVPNPINPSNLKDDEKPTSDKPTETLPSAKNSNVIYGQMRNQAGDLVNVALSSANPTITKDALNGKLTLTVVPGTESTKGTKHTVRKTGKSKVQKQGEAKKEYTVDIKTHRENFTESGAYVAVNELITEQNIGLQSAGTPVSELPNDDFTTFYSGPAIIRKGSNADAQGTGSFQLDVNFKAGKVDIKATANVGAEQLTFTAEKMDLNDSGVFSTTTGKIGVDGTDGATESASIDGYFAGKGAEGVHGLAYSNDTQNYTGAFYGRKSQ